MLPGKTHGVQTAFDILRRRAWLIVIPPFAALFVALVVSHQLPDLYQSDVLIAIVAQRVPDSLVKSTVTIKTEDRLDAIQTQVLSRTPLEQLILELDLYPAERRTLPMEDVVVKMRAAIDVAIERPRVGPRGFEPPHAFHVRFKYPDATLAAKVTQRLGASFVEQNARDRDAMAEATNQFLETQLAEARTRLEQQENKLEAFRQRHGNELPTQVQSNMQVVQSTQMQVQALVEATARARDRRLMTERIYTELSAEPAPAPVPSGPPQAQPAPGTLAPAGTAKQQLTDARQLLARLEMRYRPDHPDVIRTRRAIADLETKAAEEKSSEDGGEPMAAPAVSEVEVARRDRLSAMRAELDSLDRQVAFNEQEEQRLRDLVAEYQRRIEAVPGVESEWSVLTRDYDTQQAAYKDLLTKSEQSKVALNLERRQIGEQFRILDAAGVPTKPISPNRLQVSGVGFGLGLVIGLGLTLLLELKDASFRTEADVVEVLSLPVLALVPFVPTAAERRHRVRKRLLVATIATALVAGAGYVFWNLQLWNYLV